MMMDENLGRRSVICHCYLGEEAGAGRSGFDLGGGVSGYWCTLRPVDCLCSGCNAAVTLDV